MANLMTLRRLTRGRIGIPVSDDFFTDSVLDDHINLAVQLIDAEYRWPWSEVVDQVPVSSAAPDIPMPPGYRATRTVFDGGTELMAVSPADLLTWMNVTSDVPRVYCPIVDAIAVRPIVSGNLTLTHYWARQPTWLANDTDEPAIPDQFVGAIVAKAASLLASREGTAADVTRHDAEYNAWLGRMRRDIRRTTGPTRIRVRPGSWT
jgi:hypothetical protein